MVGAELAMMIDATAEVVSNPSVTLTVQATVSPVDFATESTVPVSARATPFNVQA